MKKIITMGLLIVLIFSFQMLSNKDFAVEEGEPHKQQYQNKVF